jgi:hypothetical protein
MLAMYLQLSTNEQTRGIKDTVKIRLPGSLHLTPCRTTKYFAFFVYAVKILYLKNFFLSNSRKLVKVQW